MKELKMYVKMEELNEYERNNNKISYKRLVDKLFTDIILCNDITKLFYADISGEYNEPENFIGIDYDDENDEYIDIYQYFIVDFNSIVYTLLEKYAEQLGDELIIKYLPEFDLYILCVTHFGTGWDYVLTDIKPTEDINEANI